MGTIAPRADADFDLREPERTRMIPALPMHSASDFDVLRIAQ
jgi:hypothetical protein